MRLTLTRHRDEWRFLCGRATPPAGTYKGLDPFGKLTTGRFGRIATQLWQPFAGSPCEQLAYGYDYNSNRTYRDNVLADAASKKLDELYAYDDLNRLVDFKRGQLNDGKTDIPYQSPADRLRREQWTLSDTGNWTDYQVDDNGDGDYTDAAWADPAHDARGNMPTVPKPAAMPSA